MAEKLCEFCGKPLATNGNHRNRKYCSKSCSNARNNAMRVARNCAARAAEQARKNERAARGDKLLCAMIEAERLGLSYGQYMARRDSP